MEVVQASEIVIFLEWGFSVYIVLNDKAKQSHQRIIQGYGNNQHTYLKQNQLRDD